MAKRRGHGEGSIFQRERNGRREWVGRVELGRDGNGKRIRKTVYGRTKTEALGKLDKARESARKGLPASDDRTTVGTWLRVWMDAAEGDLSPRSAATYRSMIDNHLVPSLGSVRLSKLGPADVEAMMRGMRDKGLSVSSVRQARKVLRRALSVAERHGHVYRNVAALAEGPRRERGAKTDDVLTGLEADAIIAAASADDDPKGARLSALATVLLTLGLRQGEALGLRWEDVRLTGAEPQLTVAASLSRVTGEGLVRGTTKTVGSKRTIPLIEPALSALNEHRKSQKRERLASSVWLDDGIVFASSYGTYTDPRNALRIWHSWTETAGLGRRRMHASRHYAATALLEAGVPLEVVSAALGHSSLSITADVYARVSQDAKRRALASISRISE